VIASVHTSFGMGEQAMTERMIAPSSIRWYKRSAIRLGG